VGRGKGEEGRGGGDDGSRPGRRKEQVVVAGQVLRGWGANADVTCDLRKTKHQPVTREGVFRETIKKNPQTYLLWLEEDSCCSMYSSHDDDDGSSLIESDRSTRIYLMK
jgi:hypothetical protein